MDIRMANQLFYAFCELEDGPRKVLWWLVANSLSVNDCVKVLPFHHFEGGKKTVEQFRDAAYDYLDNKGFKKLFIKERLIEACYQAEKIELPEREIAPSLDAVSRKREEEAERRITPADRRKSKPEGNILPIGYIVFKGEIRNLTKFPLTDDESRRLTIERFSRAFKQLKPNDQEALKSYALARLEMEQTFEKGCRMHNPGCQVLDLCTKALEQASKSAVDTLREKHGYGKETLYKLLPKVLELLSTAEQ